MRGRGGIIAKLPYPIQGCFLPLFVSLSLYIYTGTYTLSVVDNYVPRARTLLSSFGLLSQKFFILVKHGQSVSLIKQILTYICGRLPLLFSKLTKI